MFTYNFPKCEARTSVNEQVTKIGFEYMEIAEEALKSIINPIGLAMECLDTIHACETLLRILQENHGIDVQAEAEFVKQKNAERGYYGEQQA